MFAQTSFTSCFIFLVTAFAAIVQVAHAVPTMLVVYVPRVTYPCEGEVWHPGHTYNVTWDASNPPKQITNPVGEIYLRKGEQTMATPIAQNFSILAGYTTVTVPKDVPVTGERYRVVLFGDSGNWSDEFTIAK